MTGTEEAIRELSARPDLLRIKEGIDALAVDEAARRDRHFDATVPGDRSEFINGEVIMPSPWKRKHTRLIDRLHDLLKHHVRENGLGETMADAAMCRFLRNDYYPDICFWPEVVSREFDDEQSSYPPPLFAVEVLSHATAHRDRGVKFEDYAAHGVREYWIVDPDAKTIEQYLSDDNAPYRLLRKLDAGTLKAEVIDGLAIDVESVFTHHSRE